MGTSCLFYLLVLLCTHLKMVNQDLRIIIGNPLVRKKHYKTPESKTLLADDLKQILLDENIAENENIDKHAIS